ncbi:hypothetical protein MKZ38_001571 [Zalerion maritima]|uniref:ATP-dependent bile acid permease n=1 Tax=Zalerion maritima TaxID=339359 RepID=A0AAD5RQ25_9PEZI|nr:hypothetical protein MKZ38_001571 [Zalerion maritima]
MGSIVKNIIAGDIIKGSKIRLITKHMCRQVINYVISIIVVEDMAEDLFDLTLAAWQFFPPTSPSPVRPSNFLSPVFTTYSIGFVYRLEPFAVGHAVYAIDTRYSLTCLSDGNLVDNIPPRWFKITQKLGAASCRPPDRKPALFSAVFPSATTRGKASKMGFAACGWPIWEVDDFSQCFQQDYLKVLLPLIVICLSFLYLATHGAVAIVKRRSGYEPLKNHSSPDLAARHTDLPPHEEYQDDSEDEQNALTMGGGRLALVKTTTRGSIVQSDNPPAENVTVTLELLSILGLIAINILSLVLPDGSSQGTTAPIAGLASWAYTLALVSLRLFVGKTQWRVPRLWNNTAFIYGFQWIFSLLMFRSVLIHPYNDLAQIFGIFNFALVTILFGICLTTRKGNKTVILEWEGKIEPPREPLASLLSLATFSWVDPIVWKGYWQDTLRLEDVWNLLPRDKGAAILADYRQLQKTTSLAFHLFGYFKGMVLAQCAWAVVSGVVTFIPTLLLKAILEYIQDPTIAPKNVLWLYVILLPVSDIFRSICDGMALWTGRKICIRIRAIMVGEIYAKALRRKAAAGKDSVLGVDKKRLEDVVEESKFDKLKRKLGLKTKKTTKTNGAATAGGAVAAKDVDADEQANMGTIINLMSVDSFKIAEITAYLHFLFAAAPTQLIVAIYLLFTVMGLSSIPGLIVMVLLLPINIAFATGFNSSQKKIMAATDKRIHTTNEILQNIRIIKYFAWERRFRGVVDEKRSAELKALRKRFLIWAGAVAVWNTVPVLITFFSFMVYTLIEKKPLYPSVAFTAISLFSLLRIPLDQLGDMIAHVQESKVSIDRVEEFLNEEETEKYEQLGEDNTDEDGRQVIGFRDATFIWGSKATVAEDGSMAFRLLDLNIDFQIEKLNVITGPTGSGKTSMLMALLGEMTSIKGKVYLPGGRSREDVRPDPETGLAETCAYVAQQAWLVNANIKDNILFSVPYDEHRYREVIVACALERDLEVLDNGDETLVGEKGITLSGGQKQRISLARAVYSNSKHLLLDDCLSAVDSHTAQWIFNNCIRGPLMSGRTCILVSHNMPLCVPRSHYVVVLDNGRVSAQGPSDKVIASGKLGEEVQKSRPGSVAVSRVPSRVPSSVGGGSGATAVGEDGGGANGQQKTKDVKKKDAMEESKAVGAVTWPVLKLYLSSMGSWWFWATTAFVFIFQQLASVASNVWVKEWANQYPTDSVANPHLKVASGSFASQSSSQAYFGSVAKYVAPQSWWTGNNASVNTSADDQGVNATYYLTILAAIGIAGAFSALMRDLWVFYGSLTASWRIHNRLMHAITGARFKFFDVTPLGQIMNRFSKDLEALDQEVSPIAIGVMTCALGIVVTVILIATITPGFLIAGIFITLLYVFVGTFYIRASRDLKRLESVQRSPLFQQFGETLTGVTTIRAYGDERRFIRDNLQRINTQSRPFIYLWACNRWLAFRTDVVGDLVVFFAGVFIIITLGQIDAGSAGLSLTYAISFTESILWLVRLYATNEQNMNSVERIKEYLDVEQEAEAVIEKSRPPVEWPAHGEVEFVKYSTRYRPELDRVLRNVNFKLEPHEKVGIVGRTGAGKSSLTLAIFRALEADEGKIMIDGVDISTIGLQDLRDAITIVPQEPTLFTGTIRTNLDPFELYTDAEIFEALRRVHLIGPSEKIPTATTTPVATSAALDSEPESEQTPTNKNVFVDLSSAVSESGSNLSQGQRQLLCLARAMLKNPNVLVMDEATASIDYATDSKIQETIRELTSTIITIAHRLQTISDYDKVIVLDKGEVVEFGHPWDLIRKKDGQFKGMCETSGDMDVLLVAAKKAWQAKFGDGEGRSTDVTSNGGQEPQNGSS